MQNDLMLVYSNYPHKSFSHISDNLWLYGRRQRMFDEFLEKDFSDEVFQTFEILSDLNLVLQCLQTYLDA